MIKAVFFDLYNTLARFWPPREELQSRVAQELGLQVYTEAILQGYLQADDFMARENKVRHIEKRTPEEQRAFFARYEQLVMQGASPPVSLELASQMWARLRQLPYQLELFDDALPTLQTLKGKELKIGLISNIYRNLDQLCQRLGITAYLDFAITSRDVGMEKPHPPIFLAALEKAQVQPSEALHIGDQYNADVLGARGVGIRPVLIDREGLQGHVNDCLKVNSLAEVLPLLKEQ